MTFNKDNFVRNFKANIASLEAAENTTRAVLRELGNGVLHMVHEHGNITYANDLMNARMTSVNKRAMRLFLQYFTGFHYDEATKVFTKKNKRVYDARKEECLELLQDPSFDFWSWTDREITIEAKPFDPTKVTKYLEQQMKKAAKEMNEVDAAKAVAEAVLNVPNFMEVLEQLVVARSE